MDNKRIILWSRERLRRIPVLYWIYRFYVKEKRLLYLNPAHLNWRKAHSGLKSKPILHYLEMHLATHCNIRCKGCSQFSPVADMWFADISIHERDMKKLNELFSNIETIRLVGGEPLLHPEIEAFLVITRKYFKKANICIATNGTLLNSMSNSFWETCRVNHIKINWSMYPPYFNFKNKIVQNVESNGVIISAKKVEKFRSILNLRGDSDREKAFRFCRALYFAPFLRDGKIYLCSRPVSISTFNNKFGTSIPKGGYFDINEPEISGWDVLLSISKSSEICNYCATTLFEFEWAESSSKSGEWDAI